MRIIRNTIVTAAIIIIIVSVILNATYFILNALPNKNKLFSSIATQLLHQPVQIKQSEIDGYWWQPVFVFHDTTVGHVYLHELQVSLDLWKMLIEKKWVTDQIVIDRLQLRVDQDANNNISISGLSSNAISLSKNNDLFKNIVAWIAMQPEIIFSQAQVDWVQRNGAHIKLNNVNVLIKNNDNHPVLSVQFLAHVSADDFKITGLSGELRATPTSGALLITSKDAQIILPKTFSEKLKPATLFAKINWVQQKNGWRVEMPALKFDNAQWHVFAQLVPQFNLQKTPALTLTGNASVNGIDMNAVSATVSNFIHPVLSLHAQLQMALSKAFAFLKINNMNGSGDALCNLNLKLPLAGRQKMTASAHIHFLGDYIQLPQWNISLSELTGTAQWNNGQLTANQLRAEFFHSPLFISIAGKNSFHVMVHGILNPAQLSQHIDFEFLKQVRGNIPFYAAFTLPSTELTDFPDIDISLGEFYFLNQHWKNLSLQIASNHVGMSVQLHNDQISGDVLMPAKKDKPVRAHFHYLFLQLPKGSHEAIAQAINPATIPPMNMVIDDLHVNNRADARMHFISEPIIDGLAIRKLTINSALLNFSAKGYWILHHWKPETMLSGSVSSDDLGSLLLQRHLSSRLKRGKFSSEFSLQWPGSPQQFSLASATGKVDLKIEKGRILQLDSDTESDLNIGRLLNLLSMETLSHVLTFDIASIAKSGFPFDYLQGNMELKHGILLTHDMEMDGTLAKVNFDGKISMSDQSNDLAMTVYPKVSTSVMTLVGMTGGPVIGAAAWLANKLVSPVMGHLMEMDYHVSGTWDNPVVKRVN